MDMVHKKDFISTMPLGVLVSYRKTMGVLAEKKANIALSVIRDRGVYTFDLIDKMGKDIHRMMFMRGVENADEIIRIGNATMFPFSIKSSNDLISIGIRLDACISDAIRRSREQQCADSL